MTGYQLLRRRGFTGSHNRRRCLTYNSERLLVAPPPFVIFSRAGRETSFYQQCAVGCYCLNRVSRKVYGASHLWSVLKKKKRVDLGFRRVGSPRPSTYSRNTKFSPSQVPPQPFCQPCCPYTAKLSLHSPEPSTSSPPNHTSHKPQSQTPRVLVAQPCPHSPRAKTHSHPRRQHTPPESP